MKNILAENMLRFRSKNIAAQEAAAIRKLIEQQTPETVKYKNPADINGFFSKTANMPVLLTGKDIQTVIFATKISSVGVYGAESGAANAIKIPGKYLYLAVGQIGTVNDAVNPVVDDKKAGAILFHATIADPNRSVPGKVNTRGERIPFEGDLAKFTNDIVRATGVKTNKIDAFSGFGGNEEQIAAVLKASANFGITGADQLDDKDFYAKWKTATEKALSLA